MVYGSSSDMKASNRPSAQKENNVASFLSKDVEPVPYQLPLPSWTHCSSSPYISILKEIFRPRSRGIAISPNRPGLPELSFSALFTHLKGVAPFECRKLASL